MITRLIYSVMALAMIVALGTLTLSTVSSCTPQDAKTAKDVAGQVVKVADDVCTEVVGSGPSATPDWIELLCNIVDKADKIRILMPRQEWHAIRARSSRVDAGPGK